MIRILIRAIKDRTEYVDYLERHLPQAEFVFDSKRDAMQTFLAALAIAEDNSCIHMEEDILITQGFIEKIEKAILERPNEVIQFFSMRKADIEIGSRYDYGRNFMMNQCFYLPTGYSKAIFEYYPSWPRKESEPNGYDLMIADWLKYRKEKYYIYIPSLVQHRICKSIIDPRRSSRRQSPTFTDAV